MTKDEATDYLDSLGLLPFDLTIIVGVGNTWNNKGGIIAYPGLKANHNMQISLLPDKSNIEDVRRTYLINRFHGTEVKINDINKSRLKAIHRTYRNSIIKKNKDFECILSFIHTEIKFNYSAVSINKGHINFTIPIKDSMLDYSAYLAYNVYNNVFNIRELKPNSYISIGKHFIQFQKDLYNKQVININK